MAWPLTVGRRLALAALTVWLVSVAVFFLMRAGPGDPVSAALARGEGGVDSAVAQQLRHELGLNRPLVVQYTDWLWDMLRLDPGRSIATGRDVTAQIGPRALLTLELAVSAALLASVAGTVLGLVAAWSAGGWIDRAIVTAALAALSVPAFWIGLLAVIAFASWFGVLLGSGYVHAWESPVSHIAALAPAAAILALRPAALVVRVVRFGTGSESGQGYVVAARARGASRWRGTWRHAFRVGALPAIPVLGVQFVYLLGGSVVVEQVFGLPGLGRAVLDAVSARDYPVIQFVVVLFACAAVVASVASDAIHALLDPRVRR